MSYVVQMDEAMAAEGTQLLVELASSLAPALDAPAWQTLLKGLSIASSTDHFSAVLNPHARSVIQCAQKEICIGSCRELSLYTEPGTRLLDFVQRLGVLS